jgi:hypothetical protein
VAGIKVVCHAPCKALLRVLSPKPVPSSRADDCCLHLDDVYRRPDPLIYRQSCLMSKGLSVTRDNPDMQLFAPGAGPRGLAAPVASSDLVADHLYRVRIQVWNGSYDVPAVGLPVAVSFVDFGVGASSHAVGMDVVDLGVTGSPDCPAYAVVDWRTPAVPGHYCLLALLDGTDDAPP